MSRRNLYRNLHRAFAAAALVIAAGTVPASAYRMIQNTTVGTVSAGYLVPCWDAGGFAHWGGSSISWYLNTAGQGSGAATPLQNALASWTNVANADHSLSYAGTTGAGWSTDGQNTVLWANGNGCTSSCLALTALTLQSGQVIVETDVTFNSNYTWQTNGSDYDIEAVMAHEIGHTLGIHHTELTTVEPTMNAYYIGTAGRSLEADDEAALQCAHDVYFAGNPLPSAPATPTSFTASPDYCYGWATMGWNASTGATSYEVQMAFSSAFTPAYTIYAGQYTNHFFNGGSGSKYFRVRACNSGGCSAYSASDGPIGYWSPCL